MTENRVRVSDYGVLDDDDPRLVPIPSIPGKICKLHALAAAAFVALTQACFIQTGLDLRAVSGWRPHRWKSRDEYEAFCIKNYGSLYNGQKWIAYNSPHETGLAVDFGTCGLEPKSLTAQRQKLTPAYKWLKDNAHIYGWTPYLREPWHWEYNCGREKWEGRS